MPSPRPSATVRGTYGYLVEYRYRHALPGTGGVRCFVPSFDSALKVRAAAAGLPSFLAACKATGMCDALRTTFLGSKRRYVEQRP